MRTNQLNSGSAPTANKSNKKSLGEFLEIAMGGTLSEREDTYFDIEHFSKSALDGSILILSMDSESFRDIEHFLFHQLFNQSKFSRSFSRLEKVLVCRNPNPKEKPFPPIFKVAKKWC